MYIPLRSINFNFSLVTPCIYACQYLQYSSASQHCNNKANSIPCVLPVTQYSWWGLKLVLAKTHLSQLMTFNICFRRCGSLYSSCMRVIWVHCQVFVFHVKALILHSSHLKQKNLCCLCIDSFLIVLLLGFNGHNNNHVTTHTHTRSMSEYESKK